MYNFLVLGLIPGTNIQIGFWAWIIIMAALVVAYKHYKNYFFELLAKWWHQFDEDLDSVPQHKPVHANRLHLREL